MTQLRGIDIDLPDAQLFAAMRFVLVFAGLVIIYIDPTEPHARVAATYGLMAFYVVWALAVVVRTYRSREPLDQRGLCVMDIAFAAALMLLTEGTNSLFFWMFLYPILVASFTRGRREGLAFTLVAASTFVIVGVVTDPPVVDLELNTTLIRPVYLLGFGYMIAQWGGREISFHRELLFLSDLNELTIPRHSLDDAIRVYLQRLLDFYAADRCVLVLTQHTRHWRSVMYSATRDGSTSTKPLELSREAARTLLDFGAKRAVAYAAPRGKSRRGVCVVIGPHSGRRTNAACSEFEVAANLLETPCFVAVPYNQRDGAAGRLFLATRHTLSDNDVRFLTQFSASMAKLIENLQLTHEIVENAADHERQLISRDLHDAAVQPYIGLRLGLEALHRECREGSVAVKLQQLIEMANVTVADLRGFTAGLRGGGGMPGESLKESILLQADRHRRFYGLDVNVAVDVSDGDVSPRIASQAFLVVVEGLSNIVRHTSASRAAVDISIEPLSLVVRISNETGADAPPEFVPESIRDRVEAVGGSVTVTRDAGSTAVHAIIPL